MCVMLMKVNKAARHFVRCNILAVIRWNGRRGKP